MGSAQSKTHVQREVAFSNAGFTLAEVEQLKREENEDYLRDSECSACRFIPIRPNRETHGVSLWCQPSVCPNSPKNSFFHSRFFFKYWGEVGFHFLDVHRNFFFGVATLVSLLGVALMIVGSLALSTNQRVVDNTFWAKITAKNSTNLHQGPPNDVSESVFNVNVGLTALTFEQCTTGPHGSCVGSVVSFSDSAKCQTEGIFGSVCTVCSGAAGKQASSVVFSAISKGIAVFSMQTRMYSYADSPSLKLLGVVSELAGAASLGSGLGYFNRYCLAACRDEFSSLKHKDIALVSIAPGVGYSCFVVALVACIVRALLHLFTPLPRKGKGLLLPFLTCVRKGLCECDGCCVLWVDDVEEARRRDSLVAIQQVERRLTLEATGDGHVDRSKEQTRSAEIAKDVSAIGGVAAAATLVVVAAAE